MALIHCKECGKEVSSKADKCPHCGVRLKSGCLMKLLYIVIGIIIFIIIGKMLGIVNTNFTADFSVKSNEKAGKLERYHSPNEKTL
jgi:hypothetical protein